MDTELKTEWIDTLRSDKFQQGSGSLEQDGKYCCLGVLCEILVDKGRVERADNGGYRVPGGHAEYAVLPQEIGYELFGTVDWDGAETANVTGVYDITLARNNDPHVKDTGALSSDNDRGKTFAEIADLIEANF